MKRNFYIEIIFVFVFILFGVLRYFQTVETIVIKIFSPTTLAVDFNGNRRIDGDEIVCVSGVKTFSDNLMEYDEDIAQKLGLSYKSAVILAIQAKDFADGELLDKPVKFVADALQDNPNCKMGDILVSGQSYREKLLSGGYGFSENIENAKLKERVDASKNLHPVVMNRKSKKYHEIDCKYGKVSEDFVLLLKEDLPTDAIPCKYCHKGKDVVVPVVTPYPNQISSGDVKMFLTDMTTHLSVRDDCSSNVCKAYLAEINGVKDTLDIATYGWVSIEEIDNAIKNAVARGVRVRLVYDFTSKNQYYPDTALIARWATEAKNDLAAGNSKMSEYLMHNKFMVFDGKKVATGSLNYSKTDFSEFNSNFIIFINSADVAKVYTDEFEQMLSGRFHMNKSKRKNYSDFQIGDTNLQIYFSPQDNAITDKVLGYIEGAKKYIYIPAFVITHKKLENALIKAKERGVDVKLIIDATNVNAKKSSVTSLREHGIPVKVENYAGKLHSKSIIIDDEYIIAGSMNLSHSGESRNDENMLIIKNPRFAIFYRDFFKHLWDKIPDKYLSKAPRAEGVESVGSCFDGVDNDFDGRIDKADEGCFAR